ncbi:MAG: BACON domain-containing protein, partial [Candidatus Cryptobacteroides sp.]
KIILSYTYSINGNEPATIKAEVKIAQAAAPEPEPVPDPEFRLGNGYLEINNLGGSLTATYVIDNPAADGQLKAEADADWVSGFDFSTSRKIVFNVATNGTGADRSCKVTVTYEWEGGARKLSGEFDVKQSGTSELHIAFVQTSMTINSDETARQKSAVTAENVPEGVTFVTSTDVDWLTDVAYTANLGAVYFTPLANTDSNSRTGHITLKAIYNGIAVANTELTVTQEGHVETSVLTFEFNVWLSKYANKVAKINWEVTPSETGKDRRYYYAVFPQADVTSAGSVEGAFKADIDKKQSDMYGGLTNFQRQYMWYGVKKSNLPTNTAGTWYIVAAEMNYDDGSIIGPIQYKEFEVTQQ